MFCFSSLHQLIFYCKTRKMWIWTFGTILECIAKLAPKSSLSYWTFESLNSQLVRLLIVRRLFADCWVCSKSVWALQFLPIELIFLSNTNLTVGQENHLCKMLCLSSNLQVRLLSLTNLIYWVCSDYINLGTY